MISVTRVNPAGINRGFLLIIAVTLALAVFILTWVGIKASRADSYRLLVLQGTAFTEALAQASRNAIVSESIYDRLVQARYSELVSLLADIDLSALSESDLMRFAQQHDLYAVHFYGRDSSYILGAVARGPKGQLPEFGVREVAQLLAEPEAKYVLLLDADERTGEAVHYYLELTNRLDRVVVLVVDALYYAEALQQTGIGYLAQNMAEEPGVAYIIYQAKDGIVFASRRPGNLLAIESDPFLTEALESDTIMNRMYEFQGRNVLELVRPFSTEQYPFGLFRVGLSLDGYYSVSRGFDRQMLVLSVVLFGMLLVVILYLNSREKRKEISRQYTRIKSVTDRIFEQMQTGVAVVDGSGIIRMANRAFEAIMGTEAAAGKEFSKVVGPKEMDLERYAAGDGAPDETEIIFPRKDGRRRLLVARSKIEDETGRPSSVVLVVYDITRLREYELAARRRERLSEMGNLAAGVAHEIRNPLNTISIAAQRLASEFTPRDNREEFLSFTQKIRSETRRLNEIIARFLALAQEDKRNQTEVELDRLIAEVAGFIKVEAERLNIELEVDVPSGATIHADPDKLKQVFLNLFNNAKEAFGGRPGRVRIVAEVVDNSVVVRFLDDGPGIDREIRDRVFNPYFSTRESGTGLGLSVVHKIISDLGGEIVVADSELGGAAIVATIPLGTRR